MLFHHLLNQTLFYKNVTLDSDECLVSFDVISLFTKIPVELAKNVACDLLSKDEFLNDRTNLTMNDIEIALNFCLTH